METNKIYLGSCYDLIKNIPDNSIDLVYIDIPYLYNQQSGGKSALGQRTAKRRSQIVNIENGINFIIFDELCRVMKKIYIYVWCSKLQINDIMNYFISKGCNFEILVWCKTNPTPTTKNTWLPDIEYCLMFREKGTKLNDGYDLKHKFYVSEINAEDKKTYGHPTIKPLKIVKNHILHSTQPDDIVLDCYMGSGTTCVAAKETGRKYIGMEIDPAYFKIAENRLNGITQTGQMSLDIFTEK